MPDLIQDSFMSLLSLKNAMLGWSYSHTVHTCFPKVPQVTFSAIKAIATIVMSLLSSFSYVYDEIYILCIGKQ